MGALPSGERVVRPRTTRRRRSPTGRADLLGAGMSLVTEWSVGDALAHLRISDLARSAGLTSGAFYHYWGSQDDYRRDVLDHLLAGDRLEGTVLEPGVGLRTAAELVAAAAAADPHQRLLLGLWAQHDDRAHAALARRADRAAATWATVLGSALAAERRRPRAGWDLRTLGRVLVALADGVTVQHATDPEVLPPGLAGDLALAVVDGATEPGEPAGVPAPPEPLAATTDRPEGCRRLIELGAAAAVAQPVGNALDHIRATDVADRLGLTIGAVYHYWPTQDDYRDDLLDALFRAGRYVTAATVAGIGADIAGAGTLEDAVRDATTWYWDIAADHPDNAVHYGFLALGEPELRRQAAAQTTELRGAWHDVVRSLLEVFDRDARLPVEAVVTGMAAVLDGLILAHGLGLDVGGDGDGWTLWGRACQALLASATEAR